MCYTHLIEWLHFKPVGSWWKQPGHHRGHCPATAWEEWWWRRSIKEGKRWSSTTGDANPCDATAMLSRECCCCDVSWSPHYGAATLLCSQDKAWPCKMSQGLSYKHQESATLPGKALWQLWPLSKIFIISGRIREAQSPGLGGKATISEWKHISDDFSPEMEKVTFSIIAQCDSTNITLSPTTALGKSHSCLLISPLINRWCSKGERISFFLFLVSFCWHNSLQQSAGFKEPLPKFSCNLAENILDYSDTTKVQFILFTCGDPF